MSLGPTATQGFETMSLGIYVHYPYCARLCPYCDFNVTVRQTIPHTRYAEAVIAELDARAARSTTLGAATSIFFGGGTPSMWPASCVANIIDSIRACLGLVDGAEITIELNPEDASLALLTALSEAGINRLSIGGQSFEHDLLIKLGRQHVASDIDRTVHLARRAGIRNVSIDLIHGHVGQSIESVLADLDRAAALGVDHISTYQLTIEEKTKFGARARRGEVLTEPDQRLLNMFRALRSRLSHHGYTPYEISSAARPGFECRHNLTYWSGEQYLALGAGAHGFIHGPVGGGVRWEYVKDPTTYMVDALRGHPAESWRSQTTQTELEEELIMVGLRMDSGFRPTDSMRARFGKNAARLQAVGLLKVDRFGWRATDRGREILDSMTVELLM